MSAEYHFNKGNRHIQKKAFHKAVEAFTKAEQGSPDGKYPLASLFRGYALAELGQLEEAVEAYTKAEQDSPDGKYPFASFHRGTALHSLGQKAKAVEAYKKAERDRPDGKFPLASRDRGIALQELGQEAEAIEAFKKAEQDSPDGKYPEASVHRGIALYELGQLEEAVEIHIKAEQDSPDGKYPLASHNRGIALYELRQDAQAIEAFNKAEQDSADGKYPLASYNRGNVLNVSEKYGEATIAYNKAINESPLEFFPEAHLRLAEIYINSNIRKALFHAFKALSQNNRDIGILAFVYEHFGTEYTTPIYTNRHAYLEEKLWHDFVEGTQKKKQDFLDRFNKIIETKSVQSNSDLESFQLLLKSENVPLPESISYKERLRLSYILHFYNNEPGKAFYVIDEVLDNPDNLPEGLDEMDWYFYMISAFLIGEPIDELNYYVTQRIDGVSPFAKIYNDKSSELSGILSNNILADPYLVDIRNILLFPIPVDVEKCAYHRWIKEALQAVNSQKRFTPPVGHAYITGLFVNLLHDGNKQNDDEFRDNDDWLNLINALTNIEKKPNHVTQCIRDAIGKDIPYEAILFRLFEMYDAQENETVKRKIAILQAATMFSNEIDKHKKTIIKSHHVEITLSNLFEKVIGSALLTYFDPNFIVDLGLSIAIGFMIKTVYERINSVALKDRVGYVFKMIEGELNAQEPLQ